MGFGFGWVVSGGGGCFRWVEFCVLAGFVGVGLCRWWRWGRAGGEVCVRVCVRVVVRWACGEVVRW